MGGSCFTIIPEGRFHSGQQVGILGSQLHLGAIRPIYVSWYVLQSECFVLFQMPVTFEDVALYLSREEWGRLDRTQQSFYHDVLQKRNRLALGKGWRLHWRGSFLRPWMSEVGLIPVSPPCFPGIKTPHFI